MWEGIKKIVNVKKNSNKISHLMYWKEDYR